MKVSPTLAAVGIAILSFFSPRALALNNQDSPEQILFQSANRERAARGLPTLAWNAALASTSGRAERGRPGCACRRAFQHDC